MKKVLIIFLVLGKHMEVRDVICKVPVDCPGGKCTCCDDCAINNSYYARKEQAEMIREHSLIIDFFKELFHWKTGFLRPDGCVLPRCFRPKKCREWNPKRCRSKTDG